MTSTVLTFHTINQCGPHSDTEVGGLLILITVEGSIGELRLQAREAKQLAQGPLAG